MHALLRRTLKSAAASLTVVSVMPAWAQGIGETVDPTQGATNVRLGLGTPVLVTGLLFMALFWTLLVGAVATTGFGVYRRWQAGIDEERVAAAKKIIIAGVIGFAVVVVVYLVAYFFL